MIEEDTAMCRVMEITDLSAPELDAYARLTEAQLRHRRDETQGIFIAESAKVIACALEAGCQPVSFLMERRHIDGDCAALLSRCGDIPVYTGQRALLASLTGYELSRGVLCAMRRPVLPSVEEVCRHARRLAVVENVVDAANVGAIFRAAAALGMDGVLVTPSCCDPLLRRSARVSMGTVFQTPWTRTAPWPREGLPQLRAMGFQTAALALRDDAISIADDRLRQAEKLALVLGTEGAGLLAETVASCDWAVKIPMSHGVNSLNVGAAAAVAFWQLGLR